MPKLRKRRAVSYADDDEEDVAEEEEADVKMASAPKRRARVPRTKRPQPRKSSPRKNALALSDSGCDSEGEVPKAPPPKRRRHQEKPSEAMVSPYFDWAPVIASKEEKAEKVKEEVKDEINEESEEDDDDWEEVHNYGPPEEDGKEEEMKWNERPQTLEISLEDGDTGKRKRRKGGLTETELEAEFRRAWAKHRREVQADMHYVHLLCLLAHGRRLSSRLLTSPLLQAVGLSTLPSELLPEVGLTRKTALRKAEQVLDFGAELVGLKGSEAPGWRSESCVGVKARVAAVLGGNNSEQSLKMRVLALCLLMRAAGLQARLVHVFSPVPLKPPKEQPAGKTAPKKAKGKKTKAKTKRMSSDSDFESPGSPKCSRKMLSEDDEEEEEEEASEKDGTCVSAWWIEVLCVDRWVCVDCVRLRLDRPESMERKEDRQGPLYVVSFAADGSCKDVTARYASRWCTATRKARLSQEVWDEEVMEPLRSSDRLFEAKEDDEIRERLLRLPVPKRTDEYNNHPLYALTKHLKKYEVIYPPDALPLHFHKGEPAYPRENVLLCHTRETWLKEARVVRLGEEPAKVVDSRMSTKQRVLGNGKPAKNELFGRWQTEDYDPPEAVDGIVPKNEHGNVYLFQPCMLPKGCVHLRLNGLGRIGKRLGVDMAQAMAGWEFHGGGWAHPVFDGWVVCKEHAAAVRLAWLEAEREAARKAAAKREARALANWRLLAKGLIIRERLHARYNLHGEAACVSSVAEGMKKC